jgi:hypothetical protein
MSYIGNSPLQSAFVTDLFNGDNSTTAFTMSVSPANPASILVAVSGVLQSPDTYSVSGRTLNFSAAPPSATGNISVRYLGIPASGVTTTAYRTITEYTATAGQTTFTPPSYTVGFINVFRNGVMLGSADFTATNGTSVVLASGASAGDLVAIESFYVSSVLNAIPNTANAVNTLLISDGAISQTKFATGVSGTGPAFGVWKSGSQSISSSTWTKINFNAEEFDTANCFDSTTNYRFTPTVAGYYQFNGALYFNSSGSCTRGILQLYKNGTGFKFGNYMPPITSDSLRGVAVLSTLVYANGTTDYFELYGFITATSPQFEEGQNQTYMNGFLARAA